MLMVMLIPQSVSPSALTDVEVRPTVTIKANVPDGFTEEIAITLEQETSQVRFSYPLTAENDYIGSLSLARGGTYLASVTFQSSGKYNVDLAEKYEIAGTDVELIFNVTPITYSIESDETTDDSNETNVETEVNHGEEIDEITGLPTGESVLKNFKEKVSFIENDTNFDSFLRLYSGGMFKNYYLEADYINTEEKWDNMNETERFIYHTIYISPHSSMMNYEFANKNEFVDELVAEKQLLGKIEKGDIVYDAIVDVWEWHYDYWETTGTFYNFFNPYDGIKADTGASSETVTLTDNDFVETITEPTNTVESETVVKEPTAEPETKDEFVKEEISIPLAPWLAVIILIVTGMACLVMYLRRKKKISHDNNVK